MKGEERLNKFFERFFEDLGYPEVECFLDSDFAYYNTTNEIGYTLYTYPYSDEGFQKYLEMTFDYVPECLIITLSLLHELGHYINKCHTKKQFLHYKKWANKLHKQKARTREELINKQIKYCGLKDEAIATKTAVRLLINNYTFIQEWEKKCKHELELFYKKNNLTY